MEEPGDNCRKLNSSLKLSNTIIIQTNLLLQNPYPQSKKDKMRLKRLRLRFKGGGHVFSLSSSSSCKIILLSTLFILFSSPSTVMVVKGQPFLNSLAVLFRARPPWPTTFPSSKFTAIPSPILSAQGSHQGILVAHPISPTGGSGGGISNGVGGSNYDSTNSNTNNHDPTTNNNNNNNNDGGGDSNKNPETIETAQSSNSGHSGQIPPAPSNFIPLPSSPTISPPIPVFPPPIQMFQNGQHVIPGRGGHNIILHQGLPPGHYPHQLQKLKKIPPNSPILLSSPTSLVGSIAFPDPPTTVPNPHYGMLLENSNNNNNQNNNNNNFQPNNNKPHHHHHPPPPHHHHHHPHHHKQKHHHHHKNHAVYRDNAWNPLWLTLSNNNTGGGGSGGGVGGGGGGGGIGGGGNGNGQRGFNNNNQHQIPHSDSGLTVKENARRQKKLKDFRPSPQLNSFVETTVISDYNAHVKSNGGGAGGQAGMTSTSKEKPSLITADQSGSAPLAHYPRFESGFRPISFNQYAAQFGTTATRPHYTNSQQQYFNPWSIAFDPNNPQTYNQQNQQNPYQTQENEYQVNRGEKPFRQDRKITASQSVVTTASDVSVEEGSTEEDGGEGDNNEERRMTMHQADGDGEDGEDGNGGGEFVYVRGKKKSSGGGGGGDEVHLRRDNKGKSRHRFSSKGKKHHQLNQRGPTTSSSSSTTASSELVEEWLPPNLRIQKKSDGRRKYPTFAKKNNKNIPKGGGGGSSKESSSSSKESSQKNGGPKGQMKLPDKCDKFHKFGFCPVTRQYPLDAAEKIASRCSALLSHLIAPLPKMDVQYDIAVEGGGRNGTGTTKGRSTGWSWKSYQGKPVCDTDELTTVPGWAKNEYGDWMIILQTKLWQQKAHISLCSPSATHCQGLICNKQKTTNNNNDHQRTSKERRGSSSSSEINVAYTKCVQRFTAQRLAVFDPENPDFCPVVRSVFLPSACVCLTSAGALGSSGSSEHNHEEDETRPTSYSGRQPLFSSNSNEEDMQESEISLKNKKDSRESKNNSDSSSGGEGKGKEKGKMRIVGPVYIYSQQAASNSREGRKKEEGGSSSNSFESSSSSSVPLSNGTFMIITEKFTTNESSKETTDLVPVSSTTKNGIAPTTTAKATDNNGTTSSSS